MKRVYLNLLASISVLSACSNGGSESSQTDDGVSSGTTSAWKIEDKVDPMTDARVLTASREFEQSPFNIQVTVTCKVPGGVSYHFSTFDADEKGAELRQEVPFNGVLGGYQAGTPYMVRLDKEKGKTSYEMSSRYSNALDIQGSFLGQDPKAMAQASKALIKLYLQSGDVTLTLDQTDAGLRSVLDKCRPASPPKNEAARQDTMPPAADDNAADVGTTPDANMSMGAQANQPTSDETEPANNETTE